MTIATLTDNPSVALQLNGWLRRYCELYQVTPSLMEFTSKDELLQVSGIHRVDVVFIYLRGPEGFLQARAVHEAIPDCRMVFIGDTMEYAVRCIRLHFTDYLLMPLEFKSFVRAMKLAGVGC